MNPRLKTFDPTIGVETGLNPVGEYSKTVTFNLTDETGNDPTGDKTIELLPGWRNDPINGFGKHYITISSPTTIYNDTTRYQNLRVVSL